ncbi:hypothetical protein KP509_07G064800 [Ceratopteris richardii]|uniref:Uncharacterized protein n=1 Tax=Ceratopteris richardii TaxID=49495 RepID=A0A8T2UBM9_CERRI|nr:hypothetical protein KP509_07G064800 [Ceratopteris richardii]
MFQKMNWKVSIGGRKNLRHVVVKADMTASATTIFAAPLLLESPSGQFLAELLQSHPHLVYAAAEHQLEALAETKNTAESKEHSSSSESEAVLYKRIAELKGRAWCKSLEDIMYALIVQKFSEASIAFVLQISASPKNQRVDSWSPQDVELESIHSAAALELIQEHLKLVLGGKNNRANNSNSTMQISKLRMGRAYAASAVYGYFIRRVDKRFQLERAATISTAQLIELEHTYLQGQSLGNPKDIDASFKEAQKTTAIVLRPSDAVNANRGTEEVPASGRLRAYMMSFDQATLQWYANLRSKECASVIERHTEALFGKPELRLTPKGVVAVAKDELISLSFSGLKRLILEAVAFGSFLWDVETYVDDFVMR